MEPFHAGQNHSQGITLQEFDSIFNALEKTLDREVFTANCLRTTSCCFGVLTGILASNSTSLSTISTLFVLALSAGATKICYDCSQETRKGAAVSRELLNTYRNRISSTEPSRRISMPLAYTGELPSYEASTNEPPPYELTSAQNEL
jgi:hypothetical protein